jgi:Flp pilus assembly protein TadG
MQLRHRAGRARTGRERGAALVEAAIIFPVLALFVFGIIEYGFVFKDSLTVTSATRSGVRTAAAESKAATFSSDAASAVATAVGAIASDAPQVLWIYKAGPGGKPCNDLACATEQADFSTNCSVCNRYAWSTATKSWTVTFTGWTSTDQNACTTPAPVPAGSYQTPDGVGIYLKVNHKFFTGLFGNNKTLTDSTVMRLEPRPGNSCLG